MTARKYTRIIKSCFNCPNLAYVEHEDYSFCYHDGVVDFIKNTEIEKDIIPKSCPLPKIRKK